MYVSLDETGRIGASTDIEEYAEGMTEFTFPDDFDFTAQNEYRIVDGKLIHDPEPPSDDILEHQAAQIRQSQALAAVPIVLSRMTATLSDTEAESVSLFLPEWTVGTTYKEDEIVRYKGNLYRIVKDTTAVDYYLPGSDPSTYKRIGEPNEEGIYPWSQPIGTTDAYMKGEKVTHNGKTWESTYDYNTWEPGVFGWVEVSSSSGETTDPEPEKPQDYQEWVQPMGTVGMYQTGDIVRHNGKLWISTVANNTWEPGVYGWSEYTE